MRACGSTSSLPTSTMLRRSGRPPPSARTSSMAAMTPSTTSLAFATSHGLWSQLAKRSPVRPSTGTTTPSVTAATASSACRTSPACGPRRSWLTTNSVRVVGGTSLGNAPPAPVATVACGMQGGAGGAGRSLRRITYGSSSFAPL
jgi:hypothetical protein